MSLSRSNGAQGYVRSLCFKHPNPVERKNARTSCLEIRCRCSQNLLQTVPIRLVPMNLMNRRRIVKGVLRHAFI